MEDRFIEVHDNVFPPYLTNIIEASFFSYSNIHPSLDYKFSSNLTTKPLSNQLETPIPDIGFGNNFWNGDKHIDNTIFLLQNFYYFCSFKKINVLDILRARYFLQPPVGQIQTQNPHIDVDIPHWVFLYYVNDSEGDTVFYDKDFNETKRIAPKKGRVAFFDGNIYHSASKPKSRPRAVININFIGNFFE
jgi:hypothetical protein